MIINTTIGDIDTSSVAYRVGLEQGLACGAITGGVNSGGGNPEIGNGGLCFVAEITPVYQDYNVSYPQGTISLHTAIESVCSGLNSVPGCSASTSYTTNEDGYAVGTVTGTIGGKISVKYWMIAYKDGTVNGSTPFRHEGKIGNDTLFSGSTGAVSGHDNIWDLLYKCSQPVEGSQITYYNFGTSGINTNLVICGDTEEYYAYGHIRDNIGVIEGRLTCTGGYTDSYTNYPVMAIINPNSLTEQERNWGHLQIIYKDNQITNYMTSNYRMSMNAGNFYCAENAGGTAGMIFYYYGTVNDEACFIPIETGDYNAYVAAHISA